MKGKGLGGGGGVKECQKTGIRKEVCFEKLVKIVVNSKQELVKPKTGF